MNKLLDLLNEREEEEKTSKIKWKIDNNPIGIYGYVRDYGGWYGLGFASKMIIISKEYGFIKWLVKKDKIEKNYKEGLPAITKNGFLLEGDTALLMLLAIQDEPIDFLCSLLK